MAIQKHVSSAQEAYSAILDRLVSDVGPVWELINSRHYSPFWLLARSMMPIAESIGDLIYRDSTTQNLEKFIDNDLSKIRPIYKGKGAVIALLYRHSLMHQDLPRSIYAGNITIEWEIAFIDGRKHLITHSKDTLRRKCIMSFDLRTFYEDLLAILEQYEINGPRRGVASRYNSWSFLNLNNYKGYSNAKRTNLKKAVKIFYDHNNEDVDF